MHNLFQRLRVFFHPPRFQGWGRHRRYFEGWYFKVVIPAQNLAYAFIPGVSYDAEGVGHAFLQVLDGVKATSRYERYPVEEFRASKDNFTVELGPHHFAADRLLVRLPDLNVDLNFSGVKPWPARPLAPGVMGWYGFVPGMQCYHGLVSFHHETAGTITVNGREYSANGGVGYTEKDWGSGFPDAWVWAQSNHLSGTRQPASLMASVASIPWLGSSFTGFLCTLLLEQKLYIFTTWAGARVQTEFRESTVRLVFTRGEEELSITGHPAPGGSLASPIAGAMAGKINESLRAKLEVRLREGGKVIYEGLATWAGLEVSDNARVLL